MNAITNQEVTAVAVIANEFVQVPETKLPDFIREDGTTIPGMTVPAFKIGKYITGRTDDQLAITASAAPWVEINFADSKAEAEKAGFKLITELQYLALAYNIYNVADNWTGGVVGEGTLCQGIHDGTENEAQPGDYTSEYEGRWFTLSNGEQICDVAGNCYSWIFDDVQGDENGIVASAFAEDSPSITTAPASSMEKGVGWYPRHGANLSGYALARGGCWNSGDDAGVFYLGRGRPGCERDLFGFRCTAP